MKILERAKSQKPAERDPNITIEEEGIILYQRLVYVPAKLWEQLVKDIYKALAHGHQEMDKTIEQITRNFYFLGLRKTVQKVVSQCNLCIRSKATRHTLYGHLQSLKVPKRPWQSISLDFITDLPELEEPLTKVKYNSILIIVDRLIKYAYFLPYWKTANTDDLVYTFLQVIVGNHGLLDEIVSDRDKLVTSKFWQFLTQQLGSKHKLLTTAHPQTDGQTEWINQTLEQYLCCYINYQQNNWVELLPLAQFAYNSAKTEATQELPFYANYRFEPTVYQELISGKILAQKGILKADQLKKLHQQLSLNIQFIAYWAAMYYNQQHQKAPKFRKRDKIYLLRKNIKTQRPSDKLDFKKIGPFEIEEQIGKVNYKLRLPENMQIHPVFYVSLLEPVLTHATVITKAEEILPENPEADQEYKVEKILDSGYVDSQFRYLIK